MKCVHVKNSQQKYGELSAILVEETPWNKLYVDLVGPYKIHRKGKETFILEAVTVIDPVTGWFEKTQYNDMKVMTIVKLVETT